MNTLIRKRISSLLLGMGLIALSGMAGADDLVATGGDSALEPAASTTFNITLVAVHESNADQNNTCNIDPDPNTSTPFHVVASVTSSDPGVASVAPDSLDFEYCGQTLPIEITAGATCGTATISVVYDAEASKLRYPSAGPQKVTVSDSTILVTVQGESCGGGGGNTICAQPAAPAWAAAILQANGIKPKLGRPNLISEVAQHMTEGATFDGVAKSDQAAYSQAVYDYLKARVNLNKTTGPADAARPGWSCSTF
ncbi:hypothetical protein AAG565_09995 [Fontimonas sp. SYSU GA230001]|uniref:hypothetical protein n=1 Tax=Fontimonas sp. SYSU GA230001 TaxID=3142450 RepID=UPI0032B33AF3